MASTLARAASSLALVILCGLVLSCRTAAPPARLQRVPDPLLPTAPGSSLSENQQTSVRRAVAIAERGEYLRAERELAKLPGAHPVVRLAAAQIALLGGASAAGELVRVTEEYPHYAAAWGTLALAWHREGEVRRAVEAAQRAAGLGLPGDWSGRASAWEKALIDRMVAGAQALLQSGDAAGALKVANEVLAATPGATAARLLATRAHLALGAPKAAAALVPALPDSEEGIELKGQVAERLKQWDVAVELYARLSPSNPRRCELLRTAREQLRLVNAPPYLTRALESRSLTRRGLAAILVWRAPELASKVAGAVPVFEDIVHLQERRDIITVVRSSVMQGDAVTRRFGAEHTVTPRELQAVFGRLATLLGRRTLAWCTGEDDGTCVSVSAPISGARAAALLEDMLGGEDSPCRQR